MEQNLQIHDLWNKSDNPLPCYVANYLLPSHVVVTCHICAEVYATVTSMCGVCFILVGVLAFSGVYGCLKS